MSGMAQRAGDGRGRGPLAALCLSILTLTACGSRSKTGHAPAAPRVEDMSWGPIQLVLTADPPRVELEQDILLTIRTAAPAEVEVTLPPLNDRLEGFVLSGAFDDEPVTRDGKTTRIRHLRLTPVLARRYRLAPLAVEFKDNATSPPRADAFATRPMVFESALPADAGGGRVEPRLNPVWIFPSFRTVLLFVLLAAALAGAAWLGWKLLRRVRENIRVRRMSPRERALHELARLLARDLVRQNLVKEFYLELTMIVRRYIERRHAIRAPEQTTQEFLAAVAKDARFAPAVVPKLRAFLEAADLVKFAADRPAGEAIAGATGTARDYIETDAEEAARADGVSATADSEVR